MAIGIMFVGGSPSRRNGATGNPYAAKGPGENRRYCARCTLPERRQRVQTRSRTVCPSTFARTGCRFGFQTFLVRIWEWLIFMPTDFPLPQISHVNDITPPPYGLCVLMGYGAVTPSQYVSCRILPSFVARHQKIILNQQALCKDYFCAFRHAFRHAFRYASDPPLDTRLRIPYYGIHKLK